MENQTLYLKPIAVSEVVEQARSQSGSLQVMQDPVLVRRVKSRHCLQLDNNPAVTQKRFYVNLFSVAASSPILTNSIRTVTPYPFDLCNPWTEFPSSGSTSS